MELLKSIVIDFVLFSGIEGFIFCLFFEKIGKCRKFKWYEWLILSLGNCIISKLFPPTIYQVICIVWMSIILYELNNKIVSVKKYLILSLFSVTFFFVYEVIYSVLILYTLKFDSLVDNLNFNENIKLFIIMIPIRIIEIISILLYNKMKRRKLT